MSICTHCGHDHDATGGVCAAPGNPARTLQISNKTMFGVPPAPVPLGPRPAVKAGAATLPAPAAPRVPRPAPLPLPTAEEARKNPNLVISLEVNRAAKPAPTPTRPAPAAPTSTAPPRSNGVPPTSGTQAAQTSSPPLELDRSPSPDATEAIVDLVMTTPVEGGPVTAASAPAGDLGGVPADLPKPGAVARMALPEPPRPEAAAGAESRRSDAGLGERLATDAKSVLSLLAWASNYYLTRPKQLFIVGAFLVLPTSILESCVVAGLTARAAAPAATTVDFSARKAALARRIQESQSQGQIDGAAVAELAALTTAETAGPAPASIYDRAGWLRTQLVLFIQGLLILGIAFPIACGLLALAFYDRESGGALPALADLWPVLVGRGELLLVSLVPAALLVALGNSLFVVPGLVLSVLFLFLPHVVLFEKRSGRVALARSVQLARRDPLRSILTLASFALAGAVVALLAELLLPTNGSRALAFVHFIVCDLLSVAVLPIPALVLARLYLDLRGGPDNAERLSRAARA